MFALALAALAAITATPATVRADIARAPCGTTVTLAPADYGEVVVANRICATPLRLDTRAATLALRVQKVDGLVIQGGTFTAARSPNNRGVVIDNSTRVTLLGAKVDGAVDAIMVTRSSYVAVHDLITRRVIGNNLTIAASHHVTVRGLVCRDATPDPTGVIHPDCLQAWSLPGQPTNDVFVTGVDMEGPTQGIFFGNVEPYERIVISGNRIATIDAANGISIRANCKDCVVTGNTVTTLPGSKWQTTIYATDATVLRAGNSVGAHLRWREIKD